MREKREEKSMSDHIFIVGALSFPCLPFFCPINALSFTCYLQPSWYLVNKQVGICIIYIIICRTKENTTKCAWKKGDQWLDLESYLESDKYSLCNFKQDTSLLWASFCLYLEWKAESSLRSLLASTNILGFYTLRYNLSFYM